MTPCQACGTCKPDAGARCTYGDCPVRNRRAPRPRAAHVSGAAIRRGLISTGHVRPKSAAA